MLRILRKINWVLLLVVVWQGVALFQAQSTEATAAFLYYPFFGASPGLNAGFDHQYPNQSQDGVYLRRDGTPSSVACQSPNINEQNCYDGHEGFDFRLAYAPVTAAANGTVVYTGWNNPNHETLLGLMVLIDHGNSHRTTYGHLSAITIQTGEQVTGKWYTYQGNTWIWFPQIGTSGTTGNSTGPHLHFGLLYNQNGQWKPKNPYRWAGATTDPWQTLSGVQSNEYLWVGNPVQPQPLRDGPIVLDDGASGFTTGGCSGCNWTVVTTAQGINNDLRWRYTTSSAVSNAWAKWKPTVPITTRYEVHVYIPAWTTTSRTHAARYEIVANGVLVRTVVVDQHKVGTGQWINLGQYSFNQNSNSYIRLTDSTYGICENVNVTTGSITCPPYYVEQNSTRIILVDAMRAYAN